MKIEIYTEKPKEGRKDSLLLMAVGVCNKVWSVIVGRQQSQDGKRVG